MRYLMLLVLLPLPAFAKVDYSQVCSRLMAHISEPRGAVLPDRRSAQEIVHRLDEETANFVGLHPTYQTSTLLEPAQEALAPILIQPAGAMQILDNIGAQLRFTRELERGAYMPPDETIYHPRRGWIVEESLWLTAPPPPGVTAANFKNVRFSTTLFPSTEFVDLVGRAGVLKSFLNREVEFLRYHPSVVVYVPAAIHKSAYVAVGQNLPYFEVSIDSEKWREDARQSMNDSAMPVYKDVFSQKALEDLLIKLKTEIDAAVGSKTHWILNARTSAEAPFPELTELVLKIEHKDIVVAWKASLEFTERYAQALRQRVPYLREPDQNALPMTTIPALLNERRPGAP